jgi:carbon monoxide dehydrogenase subunit G
VDFTNEFRVSLPVEQAWALLTDIERIAPCMPGAQLTGVDGDQYDGVVKVRVGPMTVQYKGVASFEERDADRHTAALRARGRDVRGQGNADARITARLVPDGDGTRVTVETHLTITGKVAQFGKGVIEEVSKKLLAQFVDALEAQLAAEKAPAPAHAPALHGAPESAAPAGQPTAPAVPRTIEPAPAVAPLDLMSVARGAVLKRAVPAALALGVVIALVIWLTR